MNLSALPKRLVQFQLPAGDNTTMHGVWVSALNAVVFASESRDKAIAFDGALTGAMAAGMSAKDAVALVYSTMERERQTGPYASDLLQHN